MVEDKGKEAIMDECRVDGHTEGTEFEELVEAMKTDLYWVRFFARPCCPAPDLVDAEKMLDRLAGEVEARDDFSPEQKQELCATIEARKEWYPKSGLCRHKRG